MQQPIARATALAALLGLGSAVPAAEVAGRLAAVTGPIEIRPLHAAWRRVRGPTLLRVGDTVALGRGASAEALLLAGGRRFRLPAGSRFRVETGRLRALAGPAPQPLAESKPPAGGGAALGSDILGTVVRARPDGLGPRDPEPLFAQRNPPPALRWAGPIDPDIGAEEGARLRLQLRVYRAPGPPLLEKDLPLEARRFDLPAGLLAPGRWYVWRVRVLALTGSERVCGGPLYLLRREERRELEEAERAARERRARDSASPEPDLTLARLYEKLWMASAAREAFEAAQRLGGGAAAEEGVLRMRRLLGEK